MKLRFIGADGSLGLKHGEVYDVRLSTIEEVIKAHAWSRDDSFYVCCPYSSPKSFAKNWEAV